MANSEIRVGKVSSINYKNGMARVTYRDKDKTVTTEYPLLNYNDEYRMPQIGQQVIVAHLSNGSSRGAIIGTMWNKKNIPAESGKQLYRKDFSRKKDAAYARYDDSTGEYLIKSANLHLNGVNKTILDGPEMEIAANISILIQTDSLHMDFPELLLTGGETGEISAAVTADMKIDQKGNQLEAIIMKAMLELVESLEIKVGTQIKAEAEESVEITSGTDIKLSGDRNVEVSSGGDLRLRDGKYNVTLTEIMEKLEALWQQGG